MKSTINTGMTVKFLLVSLIIILYSGSACGENSTVLVETFTTKLCPLCNAADEALEQIAGEHDEVIILEYHLNDELKFSGGMDRRNFYGSCNYYLYSFFDGRNETCGGSYDVNENYNNFKPIIEEHLAAYDLVEILPSVSRNNFVLNVSAQINKTKNAGWAQKNLKLYFVVREDHIYVSAQYPDFRYVVINYTAIDFYIENHTGINFNYNLNSFAYQNESNIDLIFFVQDENTKEIFGAAYVPLTGPELSILSPLNNSEISGVVELMAGAFHRHGISHVEFYKNNSLLCNLTPEPYLCLWNTTNESNKNYTITAMAHDNFNNVNISEINVFVNNKAELTINPGDISVSPQNPLENETVTITAVMRNTGTLNAYNVAVEFLIDDNLIDYKILNISFNSSEAVEFNWTGVSGEHNATITAGNSNATIPVLVRNCVVPGDDFYVNEDALLCEGVYNDTHIIVNASGVVLDCNGAVLNGSGNGNGIYLNNKNKIKIM